MLFGITRQVDLVRQGQRLCVHFAISDFTAADTLALLPALLQK